MHCFKDAADRTWIIAANVGNLRRVKAMAQVDLLDGFDGTLWAKLLENPVQMSEVAWAFVSEQAAKLSLSQTTFEAALDGPQIAAMNEAVIQEMIDFFRPSRPTAAAGLTKMLALMAEMNPILMTRINSLTAASLSQSPMPPVAGVSSSDSPASLA
jgi:hypothetical protein